MGNSATILSVLVNHVQYKYTDYKSKSLKKRIQYAT